MRPSQLAGPASQPSPPPPSSSWRQSARRVAGARARPERHATSPSACLPRQRDAAALLLGAAPIPWPYPSLSPVLLPLSLSRPNTTVAAVRHSRRLRPPLAPPTSSGAPPPLPLPPHRSTAPRKPCIAATSPFPSSGSDHRRRRIRRLQRVPEPVSTPTATAVSYATVSPSPSPCSLTVASSPPRPNLRRRRARRRRSSGDHLVTPASPTRSQNPVEHP